MAKKFMYVCLGILMLAITYHLIDPVQVAQSQEGERPVLMSSWGSSGRIYIMSDRPVRVGDYVELESGRKGYVTDVGWRSTRIRELPNNIIVVPNSRLAGSIITNFYLPEPEMACLVQVGVAYNSDLEKVERVTIDVGKKVLKKVTGGVPEFVPFIRYHTFSDFSINFTVILRVNEFVDKYLITHEFVKELHKRYKKEGIEIPFPIRTVYMRKGRA